VWPIPKGGGRGVGGAQSKIGLEKAEKAEKAEKGKI
jgi:hypothetical protein